MAAFMIVFARIPESDADTYLRDYIGPSTELAATYGCLVRAADGSATRAEGELPDGTVIVMEFPDRERLDAFYSSDGYARLRALRQRLGSSDVVLVDGFPDESDR